MRLSFLYRRNPSRYCGRSGILPPCSLGAVLAGEELVRVVEAGLWGADVSPDTFSGREELTKVLDLGNPVAMQKIMTLDAEKRDTILRLSPEEAKELLVAELPPRTLKWLAAYMKELPTIEQQLLGHLVVQKTGLAEKLESSEVLASDFPIVLGTALPESRLREILVSTGVDTIAVLTELLVLAKEVLSPKHLDAMIESGQFEKILALPQESFKILREKEDPRPRHPMGRTGGRFPRACR